MIVALIFHVDSNLERDFKEVDLQGSDYADHVNESAMEFGDQRGAWHYWNATERQVVHALSVVYGQMEVKNDL